MYRLNRLVESILQGQINLKAPNMTVFVGASGRVETYSNRYMRQVTKTATTTKMTLEFLTRLYSRRLKSPKTSRIWDQIVWRKQ